MNTTPSTPSHHEQSRLDQSRADRNRTGRNRTAQSRADRSRNPHRALASAALIAAGLLLGTAGCSYGGGDGDNGNGTGDGGGSSFIGAWGEDTAGRPSLTINEDRTFSGTDGCNQLAGSFSIDGDALTFEETITTEVYCADIDDWLQGLATARIDNGALEISDASGTVIGQLRRR